MLYWKPAQMHARKQPVQGCQIVLLHHHGTKELGVDLILQSRKTYLADVACMQQQPSDAEPMCLLGLQGT